MTAISPTLFTWNDVEGRSDLDRFYLVRDHLPDDKIITALNQQRGQKGRDDFPVLAMWNALIAGIVFQHESINSLIRELNRNPSLLAACGFNPLPIQKKPCAQIVKDPLSGQMKVAYPKPQAPQYHIPTKSNFSRFLKSVEVLEEKHQLLNGMIKTLREQLMAVLPEFGQHLGFDGKAIHSYSTGTKHKATHKTSDEDADWGKHETTGVDAKTGKIWRKIKSWFGYGVHLIADTHYEIPVSFHVTQASRSEQKELPIMIDELAEETPDIMHRCADFSADRGLDCEKTKADLWDLYQIKPLIDTREMWREEKQAADYDPKKPITRALNKDKSDTIVYTEKGQVYCVCPVKGEVREMTFQGFEADRDTLKYRCPAAANGFCCQGQRQCHARGKVNPGEYGRIVRINLQGQNRRIFTPTPYGSPSWKRGYNRRTALERINNRIDNSFGFEKHYLRGRAKMQMRVGLALAVMMAMALGHVKADREEYMRSLVRPIPKAA
jgi:hypothetical protein